MLAENCALQSRIQNGSCRQGWLWCGKDGGLGQQIVCDGAFLF